jgi:hypothetical protein
VILIGNAVRVAFTFDIARFRGLAAYEVLKLALVDLT